MLENEITQLIQQSVTNKLAKAKLYEKVYGLANLANHQL